MRNAHCNDSHDAEGKRKRKTQSIKRGRERERERESGVMLTRERLKCQVRRYLMKYWRKKLANWTWSWNLATTTLSQSKSSWKSSQQSTGRQKQRERERERERRVTRNNESVGAQNKWATFQAFSAMMNFWCVCQCHLNTQKLMRLHGCFSLSLTLFYSVSFSRSLLLFCTVKWMWLDASHRKYRHKAPSMCASNLVEFRMAQSYLRLCKSWTSKGEGCNTLMNFQLALPVLFSLSLLKFTSLHFNSLSLSPLKAMDQRAWRKARRCWALWSPTLLLLQFQFHSKNQFKIKVPRRKRTRRERNRNESTKERQREWEREAEKSNPFYIGSSFAI